MRRGPALCALSLGLAWAASGCGDDTAGSGGAGATGGGPAGGAGVGGEAATRTAAIGFQPWPYDATLEAIDWTWDHILEHGDAVVIHLEEGVPWPEALSGAPFPAAFQASVEEQRARASSDRMVLLSLNALDIGRATLAPYRGESPSEPLPAPFDGYSFADADVRDAYANYVERMVDLVSPEWVLIGIESNLLIVNNEPAWDDYVGLVCATYDTLKARGVAQPLYVSMVSNEFFPETSNAVLADQLQVLDDLAPCTDGFALSVHPFLSGLLAETFPEDYFDELAALSDRWVGVSESSYPAQQWALDDLVWNGTPEKQDHFVEQLFAASRAHGWQFTYWFAIRDYDPLWNGALMQSELALLWRDTGLYDEAGEPRVALDRWRAELALPRVAP